VTDEPRVVCNDEALAIWLSSNPVLEPIGTMWLVNTHCPALGRSWPIVEGAERMR
jgi:hypothetical protein